MKRSDINPKPEYFDRYINLVPDVELSEAFAHSVAEIEQLDVKTFNLIGAQIYAPDKWQIHSIIQHIIDFERIFGYRALLFARRDENARQGVDENLLAANARADRRTTESLLAELKAARLATKLLFESFDEKMLNAIGVSWKYEMSVLALGFIVIGHQIHHFNIIKDRYYPLIETSKGASQ